MIDFPLPPLFSPVTHQGEFGSLHCYSLAFHLDFLLGRLSCFIVIIPNNTVLELCRDDRSDSFQVKFELILTEQKEVGEHFQIIFSYHEKYTVLVSRDFMYLYCEYRDSKIVFFKLFLKKFFMVTDFFLPRFIIFWTL